MLRHTTVLEPWITRIVQRILVPEWTIFQLLNANRTTIETFAHYRPSDRKKIERGAAILPSGIDVTDNVTLNVCQPKIAPCIAIRQTLMIQPHQVQNRGMQIVNVNFVFGGIVSVIIG